MKLLVFSVCLALLSVFTAVDVSAHPPCGKVWVDGHHNKHGKWIGAHWKHRHWVQAIITAMGMDSRTLSLILFQTFGSLPDNITGGLILLQRAVSRANCGAFLLGSHHFSGLAA